MTGRAADAFVHMNSVVEIGEVRKIMDANPFQWLAGFETRPDRLEIWTVGPNLLVTVHAYSRRGHACRRRRFH